MVGGVLAQFAEIVGAPHVLTDADTTAGHLTDWTRRRTGRALAVVRPASTAEVVDVVKVCAAQGVAICPQGGNTGLVGGSVPPDDDEPRIVLSTTRLSDAGPVDVVDRCIDVGSGVTVAEIARRATQAGLIFGIDLASRDSATAGGIVATNAGGINMIRHGDTRAQIRGIEAVLADGTVVRRMSHVVKDNVGYDLAGLLAGSEGTLAIITRVLFALAAPPASSFVLVAAIDDVPVAFDLLTTLERSGLTVEAAELMTAAGVDLVHARGQRRPTEVSAPFFVLIEVSVPAWNRLWCRVSRMSGASSTRWGSRRRRGRCGRSARHTPKQLRRRRARCRSNSTSRCLVPHSRIRSERLWRWGIRSLIRAEPSCSGMSATATSTSTTSTSRSTRSTNWPMPHCNWSSTRAGASAQNTASVATRWRG